MWQHHIVIAVEQEVYKRQHDLWEDNFYCCMNFVDNKNFIWIDLILIWSPHLLRSLFSSHSIWSCNSFIYSNLSHGSATLKAFTFNEISCHSKSRHPNQKTKHLTAYNLVCYKILCQHTTWIGVNIPIKILK